MVGFAIGAVYCAVLMANEMRGIAALSAILLFIILIVAIIYRQKFVAIYLLFLLFFFGTMCILFEHQLKKDPWNMINLKEYDKQQIQISGRVLSVKQKNNQYEFAIQCKDTNTGKIAVILCRSEQEIENLCTGAYVAVVGIWSNFSKPRNEGMFDYERYEYSNGIDYCFQVKNAVVITKADIYERWIANLRNRIEMIIDTIAKEDAGILKAMLLGNRSDMDADLYELYQNNGIAHIFAISGVLNSILGHI